MKKFLLLISILLFNVSIAQTYYSPDKNLQLSISINEKGELYYQLKFKDKFVVKSSKLGFILNENDDFYSSFKVENIDQSYVSEKWPTVWGEIDSILNQFNEVKVALKQESSERQLIITFRIFNDGLGFRYEFPKQENLKYFIVKDELSEFSLSGNHKAFWIPGDYDSQEYTYTTSRISEVNSAKGLSFDDIIVKSIPGNNFVQTPLMLKSDDGLYINIHEAALLDYPVMYLEVDKESFVLRSHLCPDIFGNKAYLQTPFSTPWRTIIVSEKAEKILESNLILNLNEPSKIKDVSWIKPQKYIGIWWGMHVGLYSWNYADLDNIRIEATDWKNLKPNGKHGATTERTKRYIDFAAKYGFDAVLIEGWNVGWEDWFGHWKENVFDFITPYPDFDVEEVSNYSKAKSVNLIMHHETSASVTNYERRLDEAFRFLKNYNYNSIKTGYVGRIIPRGEHHDGQWMVNHFTRVLEKAAKEKICIDSHESVRPTGLHRTYPNWLSAEASRGNEFNAWSDGNPPEHETILPFTRLIGGPMDYTPGIFQIKMDYYNPGNKFQVHTTLAKQLALFVIMYSPIQMAADLPENYERFPDAFQFIVDVPVDWQRKKVLSAEPGDFIVIARKDRNSENWFLGAVTDENEREFELSLEFLDEGNYEAIFYCDSNDANWKTNPMSYKIEKRVVTNSDKIKIRLAEGGGCAISFIKK
ncbi:glycoside hydrolase family 97 protein [Ignavibacterium sp.]|uniref:glycoside hydrolase family 97 protein n=1 Tax=Ignavibacterium sp. TaxID=2651167 RepID=UPI00220DF424|nr:glycoside hydrolase family 97 protein [Ignavibacterium sp.]BDQ02913.1 MAG: alpha-glucosidase [Ignavibacterium sp.]